MVAPRSFLLMDLPSFFFTNADLQLTKNVVQDVMVLPKGCDLTLQSFPVSKLSPEKIFTVFTHKQEFATITSFTLANGTADSHLKMSGDSKLVPTD